MITTLFLLLLTFFFIVVLMVFEDRKRINQLTQKITYLKKRLEHQAKKLETLSQELDKQIPESAQASLGNNQQNVSFGTENEKQMSNRSTNITDNKLGDNVESKSPSKADIQRQKQPTEKVRSQTSTQARIADPQSALFTLDMLFKGNNIFWLGAIILAIGGIFLAKHSIEMGLFPPSVRIIMGALFGVGLIVASEFANRNKEKFNINTPYIFASLASAGVITCYAMVLVAYDFYNFISPNISFAALAIISLIATSLALRFGPVLAGVGIIGSYVVPLLISTGSNDILLLLFYVSFISISAIWIAKAVKQQWVWWQSFAGHFLWFTLAVSIGSENDSWVLISFSILTLYLFVFINILGWKFNITSQSIVPIKPLLKLDKEKLCSGLTLVLLATFLSRHNEISLFITANIVFFVLASVVAYRHSQFDYWPFYTLSFALLSFYQMSAYAPELNAMLPFNGPYLFIQLAVFAGLTFSIFMIKQTVQRPAYLVLLAVIPVSLYGVSYALSNKAIGEFLYPIWALEMALIALIASFCALKTTNKLNQLTYLVLCNAMLSLCFTMLLSASSLTLALVLQVAAMSYLSAKLKVIIPDWLYKLALIVAVTRLTLSPWLESYQYELIMGVHWTLFIYPLVLAIIWFARKYNPSTALSSWFSGVLLHIFALMVTTETSYFLIGDYPDLSQLTFKESVVLSFNWLVLSGVYFWRCQLGNQLVKFYQISGAALLTGAALIHLDISVINSPFNSPHYIGTGIINWLYLQWLAPACVLYLFVRFKLLNTTFQKPLRIIIGVLALLFINGLIRSIYHQGFLLWETGLKQAELYTYSIVWLVLSTVMIFVAQNRQNTLLRNIGFVGLALVTLKAFSIDLGHLEGLLRALSFIGLGFCIISIGWLFQKMQNRPLVSSS